MVTTPPRQLHDDYSFNIHLKRNLIHRSTYSQRVLKRQQLEHLIQTLLYKCYSIEIDTTLLDVNIVPEDTYELDKINQHSSNTECLLCPITRALMERRQILGNISRSKQQTS
jgi:hypothetical protein